MIIFSGNVDDLVPAFLRQQIFKAKRQQELEVVLGIKVCTITVLVEFKLFCGMSQKIRCTESRQRADIDLIHFLRIEDHTGYIDTIVLVKGTDNGYAVLHYNGIQCAHEGIVIKIKGNGAVCTDKIVKGLESVIVVGIEKICINTDFHIDRVLGCQMGVGIGRFVHGKTTDIQCA